MDILNKYTGFILGPSNQHERERKLSLVRYTMDYSRQQCTSLNFS